MPNMATHNKPIYNSPKPPQNVSADQFGNFGDSSYFIFVTKISVSKIHCVMGSLKNHCPNKTDTIDIYRLDIM
jgi:hypothetical protein